MKAGGTKPRVYVSKLMANRTAGLPKQKLRNVLPEARPSEKHVSYFRHRHPQQGQEIPRRRVKEENMNAITAVEYHPTIKDLPVGERPRERLKKHGASSLSNAELLAIILRTGVGGIRCAGG